jgi:hypothetical protein
MLLLAVSCGLHTISHVISKLDVPYGDLHTSLLVITTSVATISTPVALIFPLADFLEFNFLCINNKSAEKFL